MKLLNCKGGRTHSVHLIEVNGEKRVRRTFFRDVDFTRIKKVYHVLSTIPDMITVYAVTHDYIQKKVIIEHEYVQGTDVRESHDVLNVGIQIAKQLDVLHDIGFIHGDVKTYNIVWNPDTRTARLIDFDLMRKIAAPTTWVRISGTLAFACPECIKGETLGKEILAENMDTADMYSLGATLYHLSTGNTPYDECSEEEDLSTFEPLFDKLHGPTLLIDIIQGLMSRVPKERRVAFQRLLDLDPHNLSVSTLSLHTQESDESTLSLEN